MKLAYVVRTEIPQHAAHTVHVMKMSDQFNSLVENFELIIGQSEKKQDIQDEYSYYGVNPFAIHRVKRSKCLWTYFFALRTMKYILHEKFDAVVTRDPMTALLCVLLHKEVVLDLHDEIAQLCGRFYRMMKWDFFRYSDYLRLVATTQSLTDYYYDKYGVRKTAFTVIPNGCTLASYERIDNISNIKSEGIHDVGYVGKFIEGKGLKLINDLARRDVKHSYHLWGGDAKVYEEVCSVAPPDNVHCYGYIQNEAVPDAIGSCQIVLLPNQKVQELTKNFDIGKVTSPIKMFEYMASGRIILASDLPIIREVLHEEICYFANPENASEWMDIINQIENDVEDAICKAQLARKEACQYTWNGRAKKMLNLLENM